MNLSVIQTENLLNDPAALGCYLLVDNSLVDIITPLSSQNPENNTQVPLTGKIEFVIKDMRKDEVLGTLAGDIQSMSVAPQQWFTLSSNLTPSPKILVAFNNSNSNRLPTTATQNTTDLINKIRELNTTVLELECRLGIEQETKDKEISSKTQMLHELQVGSEITLEQFKIKLQSSFRVIQELTKQKENLIRVCELEQSKVESLVGKLKESQVQYEAMCESLQKNALAYIQENSELHKQIEKMKLDRNQEIFQSTLKDSKISEMVAGINILKNTKDDEKELKQRINLLTQQLQEVQKQNKILHSAMESISQANPVQACENCQSLLSETSFLKERISELTKTLINYKEQSGFIEYLREHSCSQDSQIHALKNEIIGKNLEISEITKALQAKDEEVLQMAAENKEVVQECSELKKRVMTLNKVIENLEREITNIKCKNLSARKVEKVKLDEIDFSLDSYLCEQGIENLFVKMAHGVYLYGTKRVNISLKNDNRLICRTGGGYTAIDQFLKLYQNTEVEEISRYVKKQSLFLSQGTSPIRSAHKRAISNTPELASHKTSPKENHTERNFEKKILDRLSVVYPLKDRNFTPVSRNSKIF